MTYEKAQDPAFWAQVRTDPAYAGHLEDLHRRWEEFCTGPIEDLRFRDFNQFFLTGNRRGYEKFYFARRQGLNAAVLMACIYPEEPEYLARAQDHIFSICNEYSWSVPAHQKKSPEAFNPLAINLFVAETALNLSEACMLLRDRLDPFIVRRLQEEIRRRILEPYKAKAYGWETQPTNWAIVCTGGVAIALMNLFPEEARALVPRFEAAAASFLSGYGDDGFCPEGPTYWAYGFGFFVAYAERLRSFCGLDHFQSPKVARMASFFQKVYLDKNVSLTFSDADPDVGYYIGILHFLHQQFSEQVAVPPLRHAVYADRMARLFHLRSFLWFDPAVQTSEALGTHYGADVQWLISRREGYGFAAKAGHNDEPHNHNDIGSFIFAKNDRQVLTDPGRGQYCREYFLDATRYGFLQTASRGHSVPIVGGQYQQPGRAFAAREVCWDGETFSMELAGAYGSEGLSGLRRSFRPEEDRVTLTDRIRSTLPVTERFVSLEEPILEPGAVRWRDTVMTFSPAVMPTLSCESAPVEGKDFGADIQTLYFIDIPLPPGTDEFTATIF